MTPDKRGGLASGMRRPLRWVSATVLILSTVIITLQGGSTVGSAIARRLGVRGEIPARTIRQWDLKPEAGGAGFVLVGVAGSQCPAGSFRARLTEWRICSGIWAPTTCLERLSLSVEPCSSQAPVSLEATIDRRMAAINCLASAGVIDIRGRQYVAEVGEAESTTLLVSGLVHNSITSIAALAAITSVLPWRAGRRDDIHRVLAKRGLR